jgi:hypothetical protein
MPNIKTVIAKPKKKPGRKPKYKTEAERKAAQSEWRKKYYLLNKDNYAKSIKKYRENNKEYHKKYYEENKEEIKKKHSIYYSSIKKRAHLQQNAPEMLLRIELLEKKIGELREENAEILLTLDEALKDNKKFRDFFKYGIKPEL